MLSSAGRASIVSTFATLFSLWIGNCGQDCAIRSAMESTHSRSASLGWKLAFFVPLAVAVVLQLISAKQADLHMAVKLSIIGNVFLALS